VGIEDWPIGAGIAGAGEGKIVHVEHGHNLVPRHPTDVSQWVASVSGTSPLQHTGAVGHGDASKTHVVLQAYAFARPAGPWVAPTTEQRRTMAL